MSEIRIYFDGANKSYVKVDISKNSYVEVQYQLDKRVLDIEYWAEEITEYIKKLVEEILREEGAM